MLSLCVHPSITSQYCIEVTRCIELFLAWQLSLTYPNLCYKEIWLPPKIRVLSCGTLLQTVGLENFAWQVDGVVSKTRRRSRLWITQSSVSWLDAQSLLHVGPPYPFNSITLICSGFVYNLFLHCCEAVGKFVLTHRVAWSVWVSRASCYFSGPDDALGQVCVCVDSNFWVKWLSIYIYGMVLQLDSI